MFFSKVNTKGIIEGYSIHQMVYVQDSNLDLNEKDFVEEVKEDTGLKLRDIKKILKAPRVEKTELAYFRKFNALHGWIRNNTDFFSDNCEYIEVEKDKLAELVDTLKSIIDHCKVTVDDKGEVIVENRDNEFCKENLPSTSGFFFGSNEFDNYYFENVLKAFDIFSNLKLNDDESLVYYAWY